jgi:hypothetical protein
MLNSYDPDSCGNYPKRNPDRLPYDPKSVGAEITIAAAQANGIRQGKHI